MRVRINFAHNDGTADSVVITGVDVADIREKAKAVLNDRGINEPAVRNLAWSEVIDD